jgi:hypothetical protein
MLRSQGPDASIHRRNRSLISQTSALALRSIRSACRPERYPVRPLTKLCSSTSSRLGRVSGKAGRFPVYLSSILRSNESLLTRISTGPCELAATSSLASSTTERTLLESSSGIFHSFACLRKKALNAPLESGTSVSPSRSWLYRHVPTKKIALRATEATTAIVISEPVN